VYEDITEDNSARSHLLILIVLYHRLDLSLKHHRHLHNEIYKLLQDTLGIPLSCYAPATVKLPKCTKISLTLSEKQKTHYSNESKVPL
jgi:hypothetical protein